MVEGLSRGVAPSAIEAEVHVGFDTVVPADQAGGMVVELGKPLPHSPEESLRPVGLGAVHPSHDVHCALVLGLSREGGRTLGLPS